MTILVLDQKNWCLYLELKNGLLSLLNLSSRGDSNPNRQAGTTNARDVFPALQKVRHSLDMAHLASKCDYSELGLRLYGKKYWSSRQKTPGGFSIIHSTLLKHFLGVSPTHTDTNSKHPHMHVVPDHVRRRKGDVGGVKQALKSLTHSKKNGLTLLLWQQEQHLWSCESHCGAKHRELAC